MILNHRKPLTQARLEELALQPVINQNLCSLCKLLAPRGHTIIAVISITDDPEKPDAQLTTLPEISLDAITETLKRLYAAGSDHG